MRSPFSTALRAAITASGRSLEDLAERLRQHGTPAGVSTLSSWQSGVNQPERRASLAALAGLEAELGLAPRSLLALLPQRRPRGRWRPPSATNLPHQRLWRSPAAVERVLAKLDATPADLYSPARVSHAVKVHLDADGHEHTSFHRLMLRGELDRADRLYTLLRTDALPRPPLLHATRGCRVARMCADAPALLSAFELNLDVPLRRDELRVVEYGIAFPPGQRDRHFTLRVPPGVRELVMEIHSEPDVVPTRCHGFYRATRQRPEQVLNWSRWRLPWFQSVVLDPKPGIYGVRWEWP